MTFKSPRGAPRVKTDIDKLIKSGYHEEEYKELKNINRYEN